MTFHIWMGLIAILSSFVLSFLGVILMIHLDVWTGVLLIITGMVCLLRALPRIREIYMIIKYYEKWLRYFKTKQKRG
jgi:hypothetical protein